MMRMTARAAGTARRALFSRSLSTMRWVEDLTRSHTISGDGLTLSKIGGNLQNAWATGELLPSTGVSSWGVRITKSRMNLGYLRVGVCDSSATCAYALMLADGRLNRLSRTEADPGNYCSAEAPTGHPSLPWGATVLHDSGHQPVKAHAVVGLELDMSFDADTGVLKFKVYSGSDRDAPTMATGVLEGFAAGTALRPYAFLDTQDEIVLI